MELCNCKSKRFERVRSVPALLLFSIDISKTCVLLWCVLFSRFLTLAAFHCAHISQLSL